VTEHRQNDERGYGEGERLETHERPQHQCREQRLEKGALGVLHDLDQAHAHHDSQQYLWHVLHPREGDRDEVEEQAAGERACERQGAPLAGVLAAEKTCERPV
jgi:hypothetical protein